MRPVLTIVPIMIAALALSEGAWAAPKAAATAAAPAKKQATYVGVHPIAADTFCLIEGPHVHVSAPEHADVLYRVHDGRYHFVGDPTPFGYTGEKVAYHGHHPVVLESEDLHDTFCYLDGPHYHVARPRAPTFTLHGDAYWYVGEWPERYHSDAPRYTRINVIYEPLIYTRPVITVRPPPRYQPPIIKIVIKTPPPVVVKPWIEVHLPWIVVDHGHRHCHHHKGRCKHRYYRDHRRYYRDDDDDDDD